MLLDMALRRSSGRESMIPKSGHRFSEKIMLQTSPILRLRWVERTLRLLAAGERRAQPLEPVHERVEAEVHRVVVSAADAGVDRGVECRDQPVAAPHAGDGVEERELVVLRDGEARVRRLRVLALAAAAARLDHLDGAELALERAIEVDRTLELGLAPGDRQPVAGQHLALAVDDDVRLRATVRAPEC